MPMHKIRHTTGLFSAFKSYIKMLKMPAVASIQMYTHMHASKNECNNSCKLHMEFK